MLKTIKPIVLGIALLATPLLAEELPEASVSITAEFVSTYVFRGQDYFADSVAQQRSSVDKGKTQALTFQPNIEFATPVEGLTFGIWGSFAKDYRKDQDIDYFVQQGPDGTNLVNYTTGDISALQTLLTTLATPSGATSALKGTGSVSLQDPACRTSTPTCLPGMYKEANGLYRYDEVDYTFAYSRETKVGTLGAGILYYTYPNSIAKADSDEEVFISYALPQLPQLVLTYYTYVDSGAASANYISLEYGDEYAINDDISVSYGASVGYGILNRLQGVQNVDGSIGISFRGFSVTANVSHRPDLRFFDGDSASTDSLPMWLVGASTRADGLITDRSKTQGDYNRAVNTAIQNAIDAYIGTGVYTYTPRQKLPSEVYWLSVAYTYSI